MFPFLLHCSDDYDVLLPISESMLSCALFFILLKHLLWPILFLGGELTLLLLCSLLKIHNSFTECELAWFSICTLLVTQNVACLVSVCEWAWFLMCTLLVIQTVACLVLAGGLALFLTCTLLVTQTGLSFRR